MDTDSKYPICTKPGCGDGLHFHVQDIQAVGKDDPPKTLLKICPECGRLVNSAWKVHNE